MHTAEPCDLSAFVLLSMLWYCYGTVVVLLWYCCGSVVVLFLTCGGPPSHACIHTHKHSKEDGSHATERQTGNPKSLWKWP